MALFFVAFGALCVLLVVPLVSLVAPAHVLACRLYCLEYLPCVPVRVFFSLVSLLRAFVFVRERCLCSVCLSVPQLAVSFPRCCALWCVVHSHSLALRGVLPFLSRMLCISERMLFSSVLVMKRSAMLTKREAKRRRAQSIQQ